MRRKKKVNSPVPALLSAMQIPADLSYREAVLTFFGGRELYVENYQKILTYEPCCIRILTRKGIVRIEGNRLTIVYYSGEEMKLTGQLQTITFEP